MKSGSVDGVSGKSSYNNVGVTPTITLSFDEPLNKTTVPANVDLPDYNLVNVPVNFSYADNDSTLVITRCDLKIIGRFTTCR